jgi:hypothetical protein
LSENKSLYCAFIPIDYEKALDSVVRDALWYKLFEIGVSSKMVNMLKAIYFRVSACVLTIDRMVEPILLYCAEVFGIYNTDVLDRIQMKICKQILGVKMSTTNMAVLGESGRYPISILCKKRVLTY